MISTGYKKCERQAVYGYGHVAPAPYGPLRCCNSDTDVAFSPDLAVAVAAVIVSLFLSSFFSSDVPRGLRSLFAASIVCFQRFTAPNALSPSLDPAAVAVHGLYDAFMTSTITGDHS